MLRPHGQRIRKELWVFVCVPGGRGSEALSLAFPPRAGAAKPVTMETQLKRVSVGSCVHVNP